MIGISTCEICQLNMIKLIRKLQRMYTNLSHNSAHIKKIKRSNQEHNTEEPFLYPKSVVL